MSKIEKNLKDLELTNSTGIKDKKGIEIHEGDILEISEYITVDNKKHIFEVSNIQGAFCITSNEIQGISKVLNNSICDNIMSLWELWWHNVDDINNRDLDFVEVIGNIYKNPDILKTEYDA